MSTWFVLAAPFTWLLLWAVLALSEWAERRALSPPALIVASTRGRRTRPEHVERLVAQEYDRLLRDIQRP